MPIELTTRFVPMSGRPKQAAKESPLGLLASFVGSWKGHGFNTIFRPFHNPNDPRDDNFLQLNLTNETLEFTEIPGEIPNRGFAQADIALFGMTYLQQIADANVKDQEGRPAGIHIEPGIWINVPMTTDPKQVASVARLANIPHGTALLAQGTPHHHQGAPTFAPIDITPFVIGQPDNKIPFKNQDLNNPVNENPAPGDRAVRRSPNADIVGVTQDMVTDPNVVLRAGLVGKTIHEHVKIHVTTKMTRSTTPNTGGGIADISFLDGANGNPNADVSIMDSTFWVSEYTDSDGYHGTLLQYSQWVHLDFAGLSWPHISVANLVKQDASQPLVQPVPADTYEDGPGTADPGPAGPAYEA